jgi:lipopolysaccharide transport system ATP-binding protein
MAAAIELRDVHKRFRIPHERHTTLTERLLAVFRPVAYERFEALRGVDLTVEHGSAVGIIGGNGSGKSTLLKIMSGLLPPDRGTVTVNGSLSALLELGLGFSNELTVRENVELYAAVLGYPRREVQRRVEEAIAFADLERFRDAKLKNLSTGMRSRLGFATALQAESEILLLDEILAVGDADFQLKCLNVFDDLKRRRRTMVLVTHDLRQVQRMCDHAVWLQDGRIAASGEPNDVIGAYLATIGGGDGAHAAAPPSLTGAMRIADAWVEGRDGTVGQVQSGAVATIVARLETVRDTAHPVFGFALKAEDGTLVFNENTQSLGGGTDEFAAGSVIELRVEFVAALRDGTYSVILAIADPAAAVLIDFADGVAEFTVHGSRCQLALAEVGTPLSWIDLQAAVQWRVAAARRVAAVAATK